VNFPFHYYLLAFGSAWVTALLALPLWRRWCIRTGLVDDPGHRKIHYEPVPLAGGLAVMSGLLLPAAAAIAILWWRGSQGPAAGVGPESVDPGLTVNPGYYLRYGLGRRALELGAIFLGGLGMLIVGLVDDKYELSPRVKFAGQLLIAGLVAAAGIRITLFVPSLVFSYAVTILWILTVINGYFAGIAAVNGQYLVGLIAFLTTGALLGFLPYNFPRARAFLGDAGSHLVGYLLAVLAILPHFHTPAQPRRWAVLTPLLVLAVPLADMAWVVILRWRIGQPFYQGDNNHLSHRLVRAGFTRARAVLLIWLGALLAGALACI
jgi:UDP-GlcNAc:undecaprenyl-phosphate GlcNAc-1-phosphate transferase